MSLSRKSRKKDFMGDTGNCRFDAGKGDEARPCDVKKYRKNYDSINWGREEIAVPVKPKLSQKLRKWLAGSSEDI